MQRIFLIDISDKIKKISIKEQKRIFEKTKKKQIFSAY
jgi:hypothetical protein